jgi:tetratricopeptide (TPR) repeat protein
MRALFLLLCLWSGSSAILRAADLAAARGRFAGGNYEEVIATAMEGRREAPGDAEWPLLLGEALEKVGRYGEAAENLDQACRDFPANLRLRHAAWLAARSAGHANEAAAHFAEMENLANTRPFLYRAPVDRLALGRVALLLGADPKAVLEQFYDPVRKAEPELRESWLTSGELALEKGDFALAAKSFDAAAKKFPQDPEAWFGLARASESGDGEAMVEALGKVFDLNPTHEGALLLLANRRIDLEEFGEAEKAIAAALATNPHSPQAHALRAVVAHLHNDPATEAAARTAARQPWRDNPAVPNLIGRKLSQKYRFAEGAALQREALRLDPKFLPAKSQLASDLLRLGQDDEGWKLAAEVQAADPYDVVAFNLTALRDVLAKFRTLKSEHFLLRMDPREAEIYGVDALALLERAHETLTKKYGMPLREKTIVEIFPDQKDFAIRTFGLPGGAGYLGVCFGRVITANSPASRAGSPASWEAILWHEFTHVVTLTMTKNKMPRWLSEGISVHEERQQRSAWGEQMKPRYRAMILGADLTPLSQLSSAFLQPKTPAHLGFAYYESSLVVGWLTERWGLEKMKALLGDLGRGTEINAALAAHYLPIAALDAEFAAYARQVATGTGPKLDWTPPKPAELASAPADFLAAHPDNFDALLAQARRLIEERQWAAAKTPLLRLIELYPEQREPDGAYALLARAQGELGETDAELATLTRLGDLAADATDAFERLMNIHAQRKDWAKVLDYAARYEAVDPLRAEPYRFEAEASEASGKPARAIAAYRTLIRLGPGDPAATHYRLARLLHAAGDPAARRETLLALEEAPRFRAAQELLLEIVGGGKR